MAGSNKLKVAGIVVAGGKSTRFGRDKLSEIIDDKPILAWSTSLLSLYPGIDFVALGTVDGENAKRLISGHTASNISISPAGRSRQHTVASALEIIPPEYELILIHDASRPLATNKLVKSMLSLSDQFGCIAPVLAINSAVKRVEGKVISDNFEDRLYLSQTPQLVYSRPLRYAINRYKDCLERFRDTSHLMSEFGVTVTTVPGEISNIKITYLDDLRMAKMFLKMGFYQD